jgi:hypothetical protein
MRSISTSRRRPFRAGLALAIMLLAAGLGAGCSLSSPSSGQDSTTEHLPTHTPPPASTPGVPKQLTLLTGMPAIQPHLSAIPAFTTDDMATYVKANPLGSGATITRNEFLPSKTVSAFLGGASTTRPDGTLLGFVEESGSFTFPGPSGDSSQGQRFAAWTFASMAREHAVRYASARSSQTYPFAFRVFDDQTGNLIMYGGLLQKTPAKPPTPTPLPATPTQGPPPAQLSVSPMQTTEFCINKDWRNKITVKNVGGQTLTWHVSGLPTGVSATPSSGSLSPGASTDIALSGQTGAGFTFTISSNGGTQNVTITCQ